jgi:hypothetical protein
VAGEWGVDGEVSAVVRETMDPGGRGDDKASVIPAKAETHVLIEKVDSA